MGGGEGRGPSCLCVQVCEFVSLGVCECVDEWMRMDMCVYECVGVCMDV